MTTGWPLFYPEMAVQEVSAPDPKTFLSGFANVSFSDYFFHSGDKLAFLSGFHRVKVRFFLSGF